MNLALLKYFKLNELLIYYCKYLFDMLKSMNSHKKHLHPTIFKVIACSFKQLPK